jgi:hypothetical protein
MTGRSALSGGRTVSRPSDHAEALGKRAGRMVEANLDLLAVGVRRCRSRDGLRSG